MMFFLIRDVGNDVTDMRSRIGKYAVAFLPTEFLFYPFFTVDEFIGFNLDLLDEICNQDRWIKAHKDVDMIRHAMYSQHLSLSVLDQACNVFVQFIFIFSIDEAMPTLDRKDKMKVDLKICVGHYGLR